MCMTQPETFVPSRRRRSSHLPSTLVAGVACALAALVALGGCALPGADAEDAAPSSAASDSRSADIFSVAINALGTNDPYSENVQQTTPTPSATPAAPAADVPQATPVATTTPAASAAQEDAPAQSTLADVAQDEVSASLSPSARDAQAHAYGSPVTVDGPGTAYPVYATWATDGEGLWCAIFTTDNGVQLYAYQMTTGWTFYTYNGRQVYCVAETSSAYGQVGPAGVASSWRDAADPSVWY